ncbi:phosphoglycerate kinase [Desulfonatronovibrio hydrogenovorans]|uniref:phosphoglycerate kinase n=1 Tax=Desulfonatronovibrio hydrogenovorans TaxID=53245 RepID=UPI000490B8DD|nr:phosphoglycerate kinase [Desulfonatronovibrio hydrogenovorans]
MKFIDSQDITGKRLLIRVDYNVPLKNGEIQDDNRIKASLPTLRLALEKGASLVICSHLGKPKGQIKPELSLRPVAERLEQLLETRVEFIDDCVGQKALEASGALKPGQVVMLENLRFHKGEEKNDPAFSRELAAMGEAYVNDAFGVAHRAHASVVGVTEYFDFCMGGLLLEKEWKYLSRIVDPQRPFVLISGGAKVSSKLGVLNNLLDKVDAMVIGGAMANTFILAMGHSTGRSLVEEDLVEEARDIMHKARDRKVGFYLPVDFIVGQGPDSQDGVEVVPFQDIPDDKMALDIGPATCTMFAEVLHKSGTIVWNGPMGAFENRVFAQGSYNIADLVGGLEAETIVGGGDTDALIHKLGIQDKFSFISTGGGSFMEFLEGKVLPGFKALEKSDG